MLRYDFLQIAIEADSPSTQYLPTVLQVTEFLANMQGGVRDVYICDAVDTVRIFVEALDDDAENGVYCKSVNFAEGRVDVVVCEVVVVKLGGVKRRMLWKLRFKRRVFGFGNSNLTRWFAG